MLKFRDIQRSSSNLLKHYTAEHGALMKEINVIIGECRVKTRPKSWKALETAVIQHALKVPAKRRRFDFTKLQRTLPILVSHIIDADSLNRFDCPWRQLAASTFARCECAQTDRKSVV